MPRSNQRVYLDTTVILDVIEGRRKESSSLLRVIKRQEIYCCTSTFALCECIDKEQEFIHIGKMCKRKFSFDDIARNRRQKELNQPERMIAVHKVEDFFRKYPVEIVTIEKDAWERTLKMLADLNVSACDAIQIATAKESKCHIFVSNDGKLGKEAKKKLRWLKAEEALRELATA